MTKTAYRFVHLSDIHFGQERGGTLVVHDDVRDQLIRDCRDMASKGGPADGIVITGDVAYSGTEEEFKKGGEWIENLAAAVGCELTAVRTIPGNHDINRKRVDKHCRIAHDHLRRMRAEAVDGELEALNLAEEGNSLLPKIQAYREFAARFGCDFQSVQNPTWRKDYPLGPHYRLAFVGMNSVQVCDDNDDLGKMVLGNAQYVLKEEDNVEYVVLVHHPLVWFMDRPNASRYLKRARVVMVGHEHVLDIKKVMDDRDGEQIEIYAGAANPPETGLSYPYRYNWLEFSLGGQVTNPFLRVTAHPRIWDYSHPRFCADLQRLSGRESLTFDVTCPHFLPVTGTATTPAAVNCRPTEESQGGGAGMADQETRNFDQLQYYFWAYLDWNHRLTALVQIDVLPATRTQPLPQTLERMALDTAKRKGKLGELWDIVMQSVPSEKRAENPYGAGTTRG